MGTLAKRIVRHKVAPTEKENMTILAGVSCQGIDLSNRGPSA